MTTRRRVVYEDEAKPHPSPSITYGNIIGWFASPVVFGAIFVIGQWALMGDATKRTADEQRVEKAEREKMRETFMTSQNQLVTVLGRLDSRMSVAEKTQETMTRQLEKFGDILLRADPPARAPRSR